MLNASVDRSQDSSESHVADGKVSGLLLFIYQSLLAHYGPQHWWPAEEPFEVMVGAILPQSCAWRNVEKAISALKGAKAMSAASLRRISITELAALIRPCGYYNAKALKLKRLSQWLWKCCGDDLSKLASFDTADLREQLLSTYGIGEETADSILLYALGKPVFVIDAYTRRILSRIGLTPEDGSYAEYQALFMGNLPQSFELYKEYHALLVHLAKDACRKQPLCQECPLASICNYNTEKRISPFGKRQN